MPDAEQKRSNNRWVAVRSAGIALLGLVAAVVTELSIPAILLTLLAALTLPVSPAKARKWAMISVGVAALASTLGLARFAVDKGILGIVEAGQRATSKSAIWRLREIVLAQDGLRKSPLWDPDKDGVGSAALIEALAGKAPIRAGASEVELRLNYRYRNVVETPLGPSIRVGAYLFLVCLPTTSGGWTASATDAVDDERAERRFMVYGWPAESSLDVTTVFASDERDAVVMLDGEPASAYRGPAAPPPCDAAVGDRASEWIRWKDKEPRRTLPGDG